MPIVEKPSSCSIFRDNQSHACTINVKRLKVLIFEWGEQSLARLMMYANFCGWKSQWPVDGSKSETACNTSDFKSSKVPEPSLALFRLFLKVSSTESDTGREEESTPGWDSREESSTPGRLASFDSRSGSDKVDVLPEIRWPVGLEESLKIVRPTKLSTLAQGSSDRLQSSVKVFLLPSEKVISVTRSLAKASMSSGLSLVPVGTNKVFLARGWSRIKVLPFKTHLSAW